MKKILLSIFCFVICLTLVGCSSNSDNQALKNLDTQLDRVSEIVSSTSSSEVSEVSPSNSQPYTNTNYQLPRLRQTAYQNMIKEEELRQDVLNLSAYLKDAQSNKYKLGKNKANALNDLSGSLSKYVTYLNDTKSEVKNNVNKIKKSTKLQSLNIEQAKSAYVELSNNMNERLSYLSNLYNTMNEIACILENSIVEDNNENNNVDTQNTQEKSYDNYSNTNNIDTYNNYQKITTEQTNTTTNNTNVNNTNQTNQIQYPQNNHNNYYNWRGRNNRFNPNRNTDTFYPEYRNIDTYRIYPNYYNNYNNYNTPTNYNNIPATRIINDNQSELNTNYQNTNNDKDDNLFVENTEYGKEPKTTQYETKNLNTQNTNNETTAIMKNNSSNLEKEKIIEAPNKNIHDFKKIVDKFIDRENKTINENTNYKTKKTI